MANDQKMDFQAKERAETNLSATDHQRDLVFESHGMSMTEFAERFSEMEDCLQRIQALAK